MKRFAHIFFALMTAIILLAYGKDVSGAEALLDGADESACVDMVMPQASIEDECVKSARSSIGNREGDVPSSCNFFAENSGSYNNSGSDTDRKARLSLLFGGRLYAAALPVRSVIHPSSGGFSLCTTTPVYSLASRSSYIYVLRHIIR